MTKRLKSVELFLAVGLAVTLGACGEPVNEGGEVVEGETHSTAHTALEGSEGGDSGASGNPDVDYMTSLALMKGHLMVAKELIDVGQYEQAEPHIGHPVEELYGGIEPQLPERGVPQFKVQLNSLHDLAKSAPQSVQLKTEFEPSLATIDSAIAALRQEQLQSPEFVLDVINQMLRTAAQEYNAAIVDNQIVEVVEYQDSRGFVFISDELYQNIAAAMSQNRPDDHAVISKNLQALKQIWPSVSPPETPVEPSSEVIRMVAEIERHS